MANIFFKASTEDKTELKFSIDGYAIQAIFGPEGFRKNFRVSVLVDLDVTGGALPAAFFPPPPEPNTSRKHGQKTFPTGQLTLQMTPQFKMDYQFNGIAWFAKQTVITELSRLYLLEFEYDDPIMPNDPNPAKPTFPKNPITISHSELRAGAKSNLSGLTIQLTKQDPKKILGLETYQSPGAGSVLRLSSQRTSDNSWLRLLVDQNWRTAEDKAVQLDWAFNVMASAFVVSATTTNRVYYCETYGKFNSCASPAIHSYLAGDKNLPGLSIAEPLSQIKALRPSVVASDHQAASTSGQAESGDALDQPEIMETVTVVFKREFFHHYNLIPGTKEAKEYKVLPAPARSTR